jgi:hypothetical protein
MVSYRTQHFGSYWGKSGHGAGLAVNGSIANDPKRTTGKQFTDEFMPRPKPLCHLDVGENAFGRFEVTAPGLGDEKESRAAVKQLYVRANGVSTLARIAASLPSSTARLTARASWMLPRESLASLLLGVCFQTRLRIYKFDFRSCSGRKRFQFSGVPPR